MSIKKKFIVFLCYIGLFFIFGFFLFYQNEKRNLRVSFVDEQAQAEKTFDKILDLETRSLKAYVYDYTYWDEMVNFIQNKNQTWAKQNIDPGLAGFKANFAWAYNVNFDLVYSTKTPESNPVEIEETLASALKGLFASNPSQRFCHFFVKVPDGLVEIRGASVHSSEDLERKEPPQGYYVAGRLWGADFVKELASETESDVQILPVSNSLKKDALGEKDSLTTLSFIRSIKDWQGQDISYLAVKIDSLEIQRIQSSSKYHLIGIFIFIFILIILLILFFDFFINKPLGLIANALQKNDVTARQKLLSLKSEFKLIGSLINNFILQKEKLSSEIEQRKKAEEALGAIEPQQRAILNNISDLAWLKSRDGEFLAVNESFARASGRRQEEILGKKDADFYPKELAEKYRVDDMDVMSAGERKVFEENFLDAKGKMLWIETVKTPVRSVSGEIIGTAGIARDMTQHRNEELEAQRRQKELEQANKDLALNEKALKNILYDLKEAHEQVTRTQNQLLQSEKMSAVGELSAGVAHEIKNPLAIILLSAESLESRLKPIDERTKNNIQMIKDAAERANKIVVELLNFSRHTELELKKCSLHQTLDSAANLVDHTAKMKNVEIRKEYFSKEDIHLLADSVLLQQVFINLFNNAMDAMGEKGGAVTIKTHMSDDTAFIKDNKLVVVEISDTGSGMPKNVMARIFEPFYTTKEQGKGTGLGLSLAYTIIQGHSGTITVDSKLGSGTKFTIVLPALTEVKNSG